MFRLVSPFSWLDSLADEEEFMGGLSERYPSTRILIFPQREDTSVDQTPDQEEEEEEMEIEEPLVVEGNELMTGDFFDDLPAAAKLMDTRVPSNLSPPESKTKDGYSFCTYSYSTCLTADDNGRRVDSTRRRYEDSAGRLKAQHNRRIGDGTQEQTVSSGSVEDFENAWKSTPFGVAEEHAKAQGAKHQSVLPDYPQSEELP
ncbi:unnamed protein product [Peronospora belbahrii]|uniref:Uncharacterized protein n=1 Tax=Peronospora belbahrii TaxID=622444 RepID=A0ABN8D282_9STRA|nr:unnamed protein product [Peronospora belbahrii]